MEEFESEDQQIEALKKWWKENGTSLLLGLGIGIAGLLGWREYLDYRTTHSAEASDIYLQVQQQAATSKLDEAHISKANLLRSEYDNTPYAALASMAQAKNEYENGDSESALMHLRWAADNSSEVDVQHIAKLRIVRILLEQKKYEEAASILQAEHPPSFTAGYEELKGDMYVATDKVEQARIAYDKAINASEAGASPWLQLKRQDLGNAGLKNTAGIEPPA